MSQEDEMLFKLYGITKYDDNIDFENHKKNCIFLEKENICKKSGEISQSQDLKTNTL